ncbi:hypothetical protein PGT21_020163 [Puccinia graminis f. sp. tritici]|uniref:Uncharacterized protein n=2 Tax=Puccinia graminis f. sp. tritici TaxID=56615 RepID=E3K113_PUCGT|nr:uncharacterized protein PGTG_03944 [Puccinia graminis f. sp. tritici CRL 75-36-700-3]EFP77988.2 hypothetical protein PGTG_03944 [Puccinia graminis f. sp. tritici CRL 75-36-700-3]KAA1113075.1 hypothetical protein PGT21_020163 [Puccinia graminis f. sp. tritici]KAA1135902.1 hypothetical protein PGTUg99_032056 [Puccinia graminis f. sp. tritici]
MPSLFSALRLGLICTLFLWILGPVDAGGSGYWKICKVCERDNPHIKSRGLKFTKETITKTCGQLHEPEVDCTGEISVKVYFCPQCETTAWIPQGLCRTNHPGQLPPERFFEKAKPAESAGSSAP